MRILCLLLACLLSGCATPYRTVVQFDRLSACPRYTANGLNARQNDLGPASETHALECALSFLRGSQDKLLRRSALGSRLCLHLAERSTDAGKREALAWEGVRFAESALALGAESDGLVHYYLATNLALAVRDHLSLAMENLARLEGEMKRAVALKPDVDGGGPLRLLGMLYLKAPAWPAGIGDGDKALELLKRAVESHPGHPLNHLFYAQALWEMEESSAAERVKMEMSTGMKLLQEGHWGYNKAPWDKEFSAFQKEIGDSGP
ncbi:MAG: tetratricopeptide repeat protein [Methylococcaceae bacterium]|nr:tetratricopeptide repeat protein [Methylococcaceae bacterium]